MSLYSELLQAGVPLSNHESDLYAKATPAAREIIRRHRPSSVSVFTSQIDGALWYDVPFAYLPWWEKRCGKQA